MSTTSRARSLLVASSCLALLAGACSGGVPSPTAGPPADAATPPGDAATPPGDAAAPLEETDDVPEGGTADTDPIAASWGPEAAPVDLDGGWRVADCDGDAPLLCVERGEEIVGTLELNRFPVADELAAARGEAELRAALRDFAAGRHDDIAEDRRNGCGEDYVVEADPVTEVSMAGKPGVRYGFRGTEGGVTTERVVSYATVAADQLWIVVADGAAADGCMGDAELTLFDPEVLRDLLPLLDRVVAGTPLPEADERRGASG